MVHLKRYDAWDWGRGAEGGGGCPSPEGSTAAPHPATRKLHVNNRRRANWLCTSGIVSKGETQEKKKKKGVDAIGRRVA